MAFSFKHKPAPNGHGHLAALIASSIATAIGLPLRGYLNPVNLVMLYLLGIVLVAARYGRRPSAGAAVLSALSFDFFLVEPYYSFVISDIQYVITFFALLITGLVISAKTSQLAAQSMYFEIKEHNTAALYAIARALASTRGQEIISVISRHVEGSFDGSATLWLPGVDGQMHCPTNPELADDLKERSAVLSAYEHGLAAGLGTPTLAGARGYYIPLKGSKVLGVLGLSPRAGNPLEPDEKARFEAVASVAASALERIEIAELAEKHKVEAEGEKTRNALLSSVSHDLRTPLASIKGAISSIMIDGQLPERERNELLSSAYKETARLERMVGNLLDVTLLESGKLTLKRDYYFIPELVGNALVRTNELLGTRLVECHFREDLPAVRADGLLIEQVLVNLLENAGKYTPEGSTIGISADSKGNVIRVEVADRGQGVPYGDEEKIFDKFHRGERSGQGSGLGLAICRGIIQAHGGSISVHNRDSGGAVFSFTLPASAAPDLVQEVAA
jgi:two-component system sensor histidine kinase KdpD